mmetsp:Transcript_4566/g.6728  ORF Transcript_4566/g.6728 Transcript_4566/m.6728 type:complete len:143 (-) Transcript_4566:309-737(-)
MIHVLLNNELKNSSTFLMRKILLESCRFSSNSHADLISRDIFDILSEKFPFFWEKKDHLHRNFLLEACYDQDGLIIDSLLTLNANCNIIDKFNFTPLSKTIICCTYRPSDRISKLLSNGASVHWTNTKKESYLMLTLKYQTC